MLMEIYSGTSWLTLEGTVKICSELSKFHNFREKQIEIGSDEWQYYNAMIYNWFPGQLTLEIKNKKRYNFNPKESSHMVWLLNAHLVASVEELTQFDYFKTKTKNHIIRTIPKSNMRTVKTSKLDTPT